MLEKSAHWSLQDKIRSIKVKQFPVSCERFYDYLIGQYPNLTATYEEVVNTLKQLYVVKDARKEKKMKLCLTSRKESL